MKDKRDRRVIVNDFFLLLNENTNTFIRLATMPKHKIKMNTMPMVKLEHEIIKSVLFKIYFLFEKQENLLHLKLINYLKKIIIFILLN